MLLLALLAATASTGTFAPEPDQKLVCADPWEQAEGDRLRLAARASAGATFGPARHVGSTPAFNFGDGDELYEYRVEPTPANVAALLAAELTWSNEAIDLAAQCDVPDALVNEVRERMRQDAAEMADLIRDLPQMARRLAELDPSSAEAGRMLLRAWGAGQGGPGCGVSLVRPRSPEVRDPRRHLLHQETQALVVPAGVVGVRGDR